MCHTLVRTLCAVCKISSNSALRVIVTMWLGEQTIWKMDLIK